MKNTRGGTGKRAYRFEKRGRVHERKGRDAAALETLPCARRRRGNFRLVFEEANVVGVS